MGGIQQAIAETARAQRDLADRLDAHADATDATDSTDANDGYGQEQGARGALTLAAQLVLDNHPPRVSYVNGLGDYDTHQGEATRHPALMRDLDAGIDTFFTSVEAGGAADRVVMMTVSEFGRRPAENGSGTDHGTAAPHFVIAASVKGRR